MPEYRIEKILNEGNFLSSLVGTEYFILSLNIYNSLFDKTVPLIIGQIPSQNLGTKIYLRIENIVNFILKFDEIIKSEIDEILWQGYNSVCENSQNPLDENSTTNNKDLNMKIYGIHSKVELLEKTYLVSMHTQVENWDKRDEEIYMSMNFAGEWIGDGCYEICFRGKVIATAIHHQ